MAAAVCRCGGDAIAAAGLWLLCRCGRDAIPAAGFQFLCRRGRDARTVLGTSMYTYTPGAFQWTRISAMLCFCCEQHITVRCLMPVILRTEPGHVCGTVARLAEQKHAMSTPCCTVSTVYVRVAIACFPGVIARDPAGRALVYIF